MANIVGVFLHTNPFREDLPQHWEFKELQLPTASNSAVTIVSAAQELLTQIYKPGYFYKKAGVIVMGITPTSPIQLNLFDINAERFEKL